VYIQLQLPSPDDIAALKLEHKEGEPLHKIARGVVPKIIRAIYFGWKTDQKAYSRMTFFQRAIDPFMLQGLDAETLCRRHSSIRSWVVNYSKNFATNSVNAAYYKLPSTKTDVVFKSSVGKGRTDQDKPVLGIARCVEYGERWISFDFEEGPKFFLSFEPGI
jgi:hypothetical protein